MTRISGSPYALVVCGLLLVACGGGLGQEDYAEAYGEALCHRQARCGEIRDEEACVRQTREFARARREVDLLPFHMYAGSFSAGRLRFDEDAAEDCVQRIRDSSCDTGLGQARDGDVCDLLRGQQRDGEPCLLTEECGLASYCERTSQPVCAAGTCEPRPVLGQPLNDGQECAPGLVPVGGTCQAISGEGGACEDSFMCAQGLYCAGNPGMCRRFAVEGERCDSTGATCLPHLRCGDGSCRRLSGVGESCPPPPLDPGGTDRSGCKRDLFCEGAAGSETGTCQERRGLGEPCSGDMCQTGLSCDWGGSGGGTCQRPRQPGESCEGLPCAPGSWCSMDSWTCLSQGRLGQPCNRSQPNSCIPGLSCAQDSCQPGFGGTCGGGE